MAGKADGRVLLPSDVSENAYFSESKGRCVCLSQRSAFVLEYMSASPFVDRGCSREQNGECTEREHNSVDEGPPEESKNKREYVVLCSSRAFLVESREIAQHV